MKLVHSEKFDATLLRWAQLHPVTKFCPKGYALTMVDTYRQIRTRKRLLYVCALDVKAYNVYALASGVPSLHMKFLPEGHMLGTRYINAAVLRVGDWWHRPDRDMLERAFVRNEALVYDDWLE